MTRALQLILIVALAAMMLAGCTQKVSNLRMASTNNIELSATYTLVASDVSAKTSQTFFLLFFGGEDMSYYKAVGECLSRHNGDILTDVEVTTTSYWLILGAYTEYKVKGNVWKRVDGPTMGLLEPDELYELRAVDGKMQLVSRDGTEVHEVFTPET